MTPKHWLKMFGGMFVIFAIGMVVLSGFRSGRERVTELAHSAIADIEPALSGEMTIPVKGYAFRMNGEPVGEMTRLRIDRGGSHGHLDGYYYTVALNEGFDVNQFANCQLVPVDPGKLDASSDWRCMSEGEPGYEDLEDFGRIIFVSKERHGTSSQTHLLKVPHQFVESVQALDAGSVHMESGSKGFQLSIDGKQIVDIQGNGNGGSVTVRDPATGKVIVDVKGDANGGAVNVDVPEAKVKVTGKGSGGH